MAQSNKKLAGSQEVIKKRTIGIYTQFEATHKWSKAPKQVKHLRSLHRHTFIVEIQIEVLHEDRELEFYMVKDFIDKVATPRNLDNKSCEMINDYFYKRLSYRYGKARLYVIKTSEDGQRYATTAYWPNKD